MKTDLRILPGSKVKVFDSRLYKNDKETPVSVTMKEAIVVCRYGCRSSYNPKWIYPDLVDVIFDYDKWLSKGHFTWGVEYVES